jgi:FMN-dependent NADH-azoreductase
MNILHIDSSILGEHSVSRKLSSAVVNRLTSLVPEARVIYRDVGSKPLPQFSGAIAMAANGAAVDDDDAPLQREVQVLNEALEEVLNADTLVIGAPMYNFIVPTQLKSWLDAIAIPGKTFRYGPAGVEGLLGGKRLIIASSRGGFYGPGSPAEIAEHHETYLRSFFGFLGVGNIEIVRAEGVRVSTEQAATAVTHALDQVARLQAA